MKDGDILMVKIAAGIYYQIAKKGEAQVPWEKLDDAGRLPHIEAAIRATIAIDKIEMEILPKRNAAAEEAARAKEIEGLTTVIKTFVDSLKHPKGIAKHFPCDELAARVHAGRVTPKAEKKAVKK